MLPVALKMYGDFRVDYVSEKIRHCQDFRNDQRTKDVIILRCVPRFPNFPNINFLWDFPMLNPTPSIETWTLNENDDNDICINFNVNVFRLPV